MKFEDMINNIINCDCYEMIKNIPDKSIDLIVTDPPYEIDTVGSKKIIYLKHSLIVIIN